MTLATLKLDILIIVSPVDYKTIAGTSIGDFTPGLIIQNEAEWIEDEVLSFK